jgi:hypothetical protein
MKYRHSLSLAAIALIIGGNAIAQKKPNIVVIFGRDSKSSLVRGGC